MSYINDVIKRKYVYEGYLPNYPYHLVSDTEMFNAFFYNDINYFDSNYPRSLISSDSQLSTIYDSLKSGIDSCIYQYKTNGVDIPDWVYSYMIGSVISVNSNYRDIHDMLVLLGEDNIDDEFTISAAFKCYQISKSWIDKLAYVDGIPSRPYTVFGEPCVIKSLRLNPVYR